MVELKNVSFRYVSEGSELLESDAAKEGPGSLQNINLIIKTSETVLLTGPSGCGKTTILRLINGLIPNYYQGRIDGDILVDGESIKDRQLYETAERIGTVFQDPRAQFFNVDTTSEMAFSCENQGMPGPKILDRILTSIKKLDMEELANRNIFRLSGGQKQKIACASVTVADPDIILLDEPSSNLDYEATQKLRDVIKIWQKEGKTIIISEHRISYLWDLLDRTVIIEKGRIKKELDRTAMDAMTDEDVGKLGLRSIRVENPVSVDLPVVLDTDRKICFKDFYYHYKPGLFADRNERNVISIDSMEIAEGKITALTGSNGTGKTTLIMCIAGIFKKCKGIMKDGTGEYGRKSRLEKVFVVMQDTDHQLFTESALDEVILSMPPDTPESSEKEIALDILKSVDLGEFAERHPMSLSGGQKQRLAIACAIASKRRLLLFDEPTSGLDKNHMLQVAGLLKDLKAKGCTVLVVTHDSELIRCCCDRKLVLNGGNA